MTSPPADVEDSGWQHLHPLTPLLRGGRVGLVLLVLVGQQGLRADSRLLALLAVAAVVPVAALFAYVAWRATRYRLTPTELQVDSGVLTRRQRRVPLARLQSVDVVRPLVARVLGLAELRLEVAGGGQTEAPLSYLSEDDARRLRERLLHLAAGAPAGEQPQAPPPELQLVAVPSGPLVASVLLGAPVWATAGLVVAAVVTAAVDLRALGAVVVGALPVALGVVTAAGRRLLTEYGFTVAESADGLRIRHGLLETRSATIPPGRVQVVRIREPLLWRPFGWVRVEVDVAGYASTGDEELTTSALLPVAPTGLAAALVQRVLTGPLPQPTAPVPERARWRAPLQKPRLRVGLDERHLVTTYGVVTTTTDVVPLAKVQSLRLTQGPWERALRLASLHADTAGSRLPGGVARHRDLDDARRLLAAMTELARSARTGR
ncbi:MAG: PH domain-containing protein [Actinomycetes bacterium]